MSPAIQDNRIAVCTAYEGDYHYGLAALANSLHAAGFDGEFWVATRGERPPWMPPDSPNTLALPNGMCLKFVDVETPYHFAHYKPWLMGRVLEEFSPGSNSVFYFDPDIVIKANWAFFQDWIQWGVTVVGDFFEQISEHHLSRHHWRALAKKAGLTAVRPLDRYFNAGFVGLSRPLLPMLDAWAKLVEHMPEVGLSIDSYTPKGDNHPFKYLDQDLLNIALECGDWPLAVLQPSAMDMRGSVGTVMCHMTPGAKPWRAGYFLGPKRWRERSHISRMYWRSVEGPIAPYSRRELMLRKLDQKAAATLGRVYAIPGWRP